MRKLFFALLTVLTLAACSSDPVYHGITTEQKEAYGKAVAGEYKGSYVIFYYGGSSDDKAVKIENSQMAITDQDMHSVIFYGFPVRMLSTVVTDPALAEALASAPNVDIQAHYRFYDIQDNGDVNWGFEPVAIPLTLHYGGATHHLTLKVNNGSYYYLLEKAKLDAGAPFSNQQIFSFAVASIYEGDTLVQDFDAVWEGNRPGFLTYFQLDK